MHRITVLRRLAGLSQRGLAAKSGVAQSRIAAAESGAEPLSPEAALKMAPVFGTDPVELYLSTTVASLKQGIESGTERPVKAAYVARQIIEILETANLTPAQRTAARNAAKELVSLATAAAERSGAGTLSGLVKKSGGPGPLDPPQQRVAEEHRLLMEETGRGIDGRKNTVDVTDKALGRSPEQHKKTRTRPDDPDEAQPGPDATYKSERSPGSATYDDLGRDNFGRQKSNR